MTEEAAARLSGGRGLSPPADEADDETGQGVREGRLVVARAVDHGALHDREHRADQYERGEIAVVDPGLTLVGWCTADAQCPSGGCASWAGCGAGACSGAGQTDAFNCVR